MGDQNLAAQAVIGFPTSTVAAALPDLWPKLGLGSTLRPVAGVAGRFVVTPPDFVPAIDLPLDLTVSSASPGTTRIDISLALPSAALDELPLINSVPFGRSIAVKAMRNTLRTVHAACVHNLDAALRADAGMPSQPRRLNGTPMRFTSTPGAAFNLDYSTVADQLPALWSELPVAITLLKTGEGTYAIQSGPYAVLPVTGTVTITNLGPGRTGVAFDASIDAPLSELPRFVPKGFIASKAAEEFARGLQKALDQCEALMVERQRRTNPPAQPGLGE